MGNTVDCCSGSDKVDQKPTIQKEEKVRKAKQRPSIELDDDLPAAIGGKMTADDAFSNPFAAARSRTQAAGAPSAPRTSSPLERSRRPPDIDMSPPDHSKAAKSPPQAGDGDWTPNRISVQQAKEAKLVTKNSAMWNSPASSTSSLAHC